MRAQPHLTPLERVPTLRVRTQLYLSQGLGTLRVPWDGELMSEVKPLTREQVRVRLVVTSGGDRPSR
jgi:hypothetical protein